jgi:hypothetical protein
MRMPRPFLALIGGRTVVSAAADGRLTWNASSPQRWAAPRIAALLGRSEIPSLAEVVALRPATRVLIAGLSGCIVLVAFVTMAAVVSVEMSAASLPEWFRSPSSGSHGAVARLQATFDNIIQRPLFSRSRQGIPIALASAPAPPSQPSGLDQNITLKGVFISGGLAKAFLISPQNPTGVWVQSGGEIAGWRVVAVQPDQVQLNGQDEKLVLPLNVGGTK